MATTATTYKVTATLTDVTNTVTHTVANKTFTPTGYAQQSLQEATSTSEGSIALDAEITGGNGPGWAFIQNKDDTDNIQVGIATGSYFAKLLPGEAMVFPLDAGVTTIYHKASANTPEIKVQVYER